MLPHPVGRLDLGSSVLPHPVGRLDLGRSCERIGRSSATATPTATPTATSRPRPRPRPTALQHPRAGRTAAGRHEDAERVGRGSGRTPRRSALPAPLEAPRDDAARVHGAPRGDHSPASFSSRAFSRRSRPPLFVAQGRRAETSRTRALPPQRDQGARPAPDPPRPRGRRGRRETRSREERRKRRCRSARDGHVRDHSADRTVAVARESARRDRGCRPTPTSPIARADSSRPERPLDRALESPRRWRPVRRNAADGVGSALAANLCPGRSGVPEVPWPPAAHRGHRRPARGARDPRQPRDAHVRPVDRARSRPDRPLRARRRRDVRPVGRRGRRMQALRGVEVGVRP